MTLGLPELFESIEVPFLPMIQDGLSAINEFYDWIFEVIDEWQEFIANASPTFGIIVRKRIDLRMKEAKDKTLARLSGQTILEIYENIIRIENEANEKDEALRQQQLESNQKTKEMLGKLGVSGVIEKVNKRREEDARWMLNACEI